MADELKEYRFFYSTFEDFLINNATKVIIIIDQVNFASF